MENRIDKIEERIRTNSYFVNPLSDGNAAEDLRYLLGVLENQKKEIESLQKKNEVLSLQLLNLTQEIENVKSDFGNSR